MKKAYLPAFLAIFILFNACTISHEYGPYMGKVIDKETGKPIEGAVVFMTFSTSTGTAGGSFSEVADAVEVLTDRKGQFRIETYQVKRFRVGHGWDPHCDVIVFKPGYGAFSGHKDSSIDSWESGEFPVNTYVTIKLPRLDNVKERKKNLQNLFYDIDSISPSKQIKILSQINRERENLSLGEIGNKDAY